MTEKVCEAHKSTREREHKRISERVKRIICESTKIRIDIAVVKIERPVRHIQRLI